MKRKTACFPLILVLFFMISSVSGGHQKATWKGRVEKEEGIPIIINPKEPVYSEDALQLVEDLTIPSPDSEDLYFQNLNYLVVDDAENIYVSDSKAGHVLVFDKNGQFVRTIGKRGPGPGEMSWPLEIQILRDNELFINDTGQAKAHIFTLDGKFLRQMSTSQIPAFRLPKADSAGDIVVGHIIPGNPYKAFLKKFDPQLNLIKEIASSDVISQPPVIDFFEMRWRTTFIWNVTENDEIIWGKFDEYEISVCDPDGKNIRKIAMKQDGFPITEKEKQKLIKGYFGDNPVSSRVTLKFPDQYPPFIYLTCDEEGRIFALSYITIDEDDIRYLDVFDPEGKYIVRIKTNSFPQIWKKGKMYSVDTDEDGFEVIKRFRLKWTI